MIDKNIKEKARRIALDSFVKYMKRLEIGNSEDYIFAYTQAVTDQQKTLTQSK